jgi:hypothetical protein
MRRDLTDHIETATMLKLTRAIADTRQVGRKDFVRARHPDPYPAIESSFAGRD